MSISSLPTSAVAAAGLVGGFAAARYSGRRALGGVVFAVAGAICERHWRSAAGPFAGAAMGALYAGAMGGSHPLAKKIGAWPAVLAVAAVTVAASEVVTRRA